MNEKTIPLKGMRGIIARKMTDSANTKPRVTLNKKIKVDSLLAVLKDPEVLALLPDKKLSITDVLIKVVALTLKDYPRINGIIDEEKVELKESVNIGVAVSLEDGLIVPIIHSADKKSLREIREEVLDKAQRARQKKLKSHEVSNGTFTITNLGMYGINQFTPIINLPEMAILGINTIEEQIVNIDFEQKQVTKESIMTYSLSFDHAAIDGAQAAQFLSLLDKKIQNIMNYI